MRKLDSKFEIDLGCFTPGAIDSVDVFFCLEDLPRRSLALELVLNRYTFAVFPRRTMCASARSGKGYARSRLHGERSMQMQSGIKWSCFSFNSLLPAGE